MAMILEVLDERGVRTRMRLESLPLTVGRGYGNDLILDDPYVDGRHARIGVDDGGGLVVEDLGSVNGLVAPGAPGRTARVAAGPGAEVRLGRTVLRFRDPEEAVPPAIPDPGEEPAPAATPRRRLTGTGGRLAVTAAATVAVALSAWLGSYERSSGSAVFSLVLGLAMFAAAWAGIWAVAGRVAGQRFHFGGHLAVAALVLLAGTAFEVVDGWAGFLFPDNPVSAPLSIAFWLGVAAAVVAAHLALASALPPRRRWGIGLVTAGVFFLVFAVGALAEEGKFTDVPQFAGGLKPVPARWVPTGDRAEFARMAAELREEVDELAAESAGE